MEPPLEVPEGAEGSMLVAQVTIARLRARCEVLNKENRELRRLLAIEQRGERREAA